MFQAGSCSLNKFNHQCQELEAALKAKEAAETERNRIEIKAAGDKARYDDNMAFAPWLPWLL